MGKLAGVLAGLGTDIFSIGHPWDLAVGMAVIMALAVGSTWGVRNGQARRSPRVRVMVHSTSRD